MVTSTTDHPVGLNRGPWLGRIAVVLAALIALWALVTVIDTDDRDGAGPRAAVVQQGAEAGTHDSTRRAGRTGTEPIVADAGAAMHDSTRRAGRTGTEPVVAGQPSSGK